MKHDLRGAAGRLSADTGGLIHHGGLALERLWQALWSLAALLLFAMAAGARWMRHRPAAYRRDRALMDRRIRERDRLAAD